MCELVTAAAFTQSISEKSRVYVPGGAGGGASNALFGINMKKQDNFLKRDKWYKKGKKMKDKRKRECERKIRK